MILRSKTRNLRHLNHTHNALVVNGQIILQKNVGVVPMPLIDQNGSNRSIQQTIEKMSKTRETWPIQNLQQFSKTLQTKKATTPMGRLHISQTICYIWPTSYSIPLSSKAFRSSISSSLLVITQSLSAMVNSWSFSTSSDTPTLLDIGTFENTDITSAGERFVSPTSTTFWGFSDSRSSETLCALDSQPKWRKLINFRGKLPANSLIFETDVLIPETRD